MLFRNWGSRLRNRAHPSCKTDLCTGCISALACACVRACLYRFAQCGITFRRIVRSRVGSGVVSRKAGLVFARRHGRFAICVLLDQPPQKTCARLTERKPGAKGSSARLGYGGKQRKLRSRRRIYNFLLSSIGLGPFIMTEAVFFAKGIVRLS